MSRCRGRDSNPHGVTPGPYWLAIAYLGLGLRDEALHQLERACEDRFDWLISLGVEPMFDPLRSNPRFQNLLKRVGLSTD